MRYLVGFWVTFGLWLLWIGTFFNSSVLITSAVCAGVGCLFIGVSVAVIFGWFIDNRKKG